MSARTIPDEIKETFQEKRDLLASTLKEFLESKHGDLKKRLDGIAKQIGLLESQVLKGTDGAGVKLAGQLAEKAVVARQLEQSGDDEVCEESVRAAATNIPAMLAHNVEAWFIEPLIDELAVAALKSAQAEHRNDIDSQAAYRAANGSAEVQQARSWLENLSIALKPLTTVERAERLLAILDDFIAGRQPWDADIPRGQRTEQLKASATAKKQGEKPHLQGPRPQPKSVRNKAPFYAS